MDLTLEEILARLMNKGYCIAVNKVYRSIKVTPGTRNYRIRYVWEMTRNNAKAFDCPHDGFYTPEECIADFKNSSPVHRLLKP